MHIWFRFKAIERSCWLRSPSPSAIDATAHRCAPLFEIGDLSAEKGDADVGGLNFRGQPASHLFAGLRFCANYRCYGFLHNSGKDPFQERSLQWDHSPTCVPPGSSRTWLGSKSKFVCFVILSWTLARASTRHRQDAACAGRFVQCLQPTLEFRSA